MFIKGCFVYFLIFTAWLASSGNVLRWWWNVKKLEKNVNKERQMFLTPLPYSSPAKSKRKRGKELSLWTRGWNCNNWTVNCSFKVAFFNAFYRPMLFLGQCVHIHQRTLPQAWVIYSTIVSIKTWLWLCKPFFCAMSQFAVSCVWSCSCVTLWRHTFRL